MYAVHAGLALLSKEKPCMSDTGKEEREWRFYLDDMIDFANAHYLYSDGLGVPGGRIFCGGKMSGVNLDTGRSH